MRLFFGILTFSLLTTMPALSAELLRFSDDRTLVVVGMDEGDVFRQDDFLCVKQGEVELACGFVVASTFDSAVVRLQVGIGDVSLADRVSRGSEVSRKLASENAKGPERGDIDHEMEPYRLLASVGDSFFEYGPRRRSTNRTGNISVGTHWTNPTIHLQLQTSDKELAIGFGYTHYRFSNVFPAFPSMGIDGETHGGFITLNYYSGGNFQGLWIQIGVGYLQGNLHYERTDGEAMGILGMATVGKRWVVDNFNIGLGVGAQTFHVNESANFRGKVEVIYPTALFDVGLLF